MSFTTPFGMALRKPLHPMVLAALLAAGAPPATADVVTAWNTKANQLVAESKLGTPPAVRVMALVQTAVHDAVAALPNPQADAPALQAAVAAANRATLTRLLPTPQATEAAYQAAIASLPEGAARERGIAAGERAAAAVLARRADDVAAADSLRPRTTPGQYIATAALAATGWPQRKPWLMSHAPQFRPGPPPMLGSELWARDYNEVKALGGKAGSKRSAEQTEIARFWDYSLPGIYQGAVVSLAEAPGRDVKANARLLAMVSQGMDDALISVMDAKYHYQFWRPVTAIRNGDIDGNDATERDPAWTPLIDTPMHPEYPCAHCTLAAAVGTLIDAEWGHGSTPLISTSSPTANGAVRRWTSTEDFVNEVALARIQGGVHYRNSATVGLAMGQRIGALAAARWAEVAH